MRCSILDKGLTDYLFWNEEKTNHNVITCIEQENVIQIKYSHLRIEAKKIASNLQKAGIKKGAHIAILINHIADFIPVFWGTALMGGVITPIESPEKQNTSYRMQKTVKLLEILRPDLILCDSTTRAQLLLKDYAVTLFDELTEDKGVIYEEVKMEETDEILSLFTSGSTGLPKQIKLTNENIITNLLAQIQFHNITTEDRMLNWLPLEHSEALIQFHLLPTMLGLNQVQIDKNRILKEPEKWLIYMTDYKITISWSPDFGYEMLTTQNKEIDFNKINLSEVKYLINTAESVRRSICEKFEDKFAKAGLRYNTIVPGWGMTETGGDVIYQKDWRDAPFEENIIASGKPIANIEISLAGTKEKEGELIVRGKAICSNNETGEVLYTGDYAKMIDHNVIIVGRKKDIIIVDGENYSCIEMEESLKTACGESIKSVICTAISQNKSGQEEICIFVIKREEATKQKALECIKSQMIQKWGFTFDLLIFIQEEEIIKTSVGKIRRGEMGQKVQSEFFKPYYRGGNFLQESEKCDLEKEASGSYRLMLDIWKQVLNVSDLRETDDFFLAGGTSSMIPLLLKRVENAFDKKINTIDLFNYPTSKGLLDMLEEITQNQESETSLHIIDI